MIRPGVHHVTKHPRVTADCDEPGCAESLYMQQELGVVSAGESLRAIGWEVGVYEASMPPRIAARCPAHAQTAEQCRHTTIVALDRVGVCQRCGRRPDETKGVAA